MLWIVVVAVYISIFKTVGSIQYSLLLLLTNKRPYANADDKDDDELTKWNLLFE